MTPHRAVTKLVLLASTAALGLAACGTGTPTTSPTVPPSTTSTTAPPTGTGATSTTTAPSSTTTSTSVAATTSTAPPGPARCMVSQLGVQPGQSNAAAGHIGQLVSFKNTSAATCTMYGYPGLEMLTGSGQDIYTNVLRTPSVVVQPETPTVVTLAPGQQATFLLGYADQTGFGTTSCPTSVNLEITPPNDFSHLVVPDSISAYGPSLGQCGAINVSPVYPGTGQQP